MTKKFSVTRNGEELDPSLYTWDAKTKTFSTDEDNLVLDFSNWHGVTFKTGNYCTFKTGDCCTFKTGWRCTFKTGNYCTFKTGDDCTFDTGWNCTFRTGNRCTFDTGSNCTFDTGNYCTFKTGNYCTFKTGWRCTFDTGSRCTFKTGSRCTFDTGSSCTFKTKEKCVVINRVTDEVIRLNNKENYYDTNEKHVTFEKDNFKIQVSRNNKNLNFKLEFDDVTKLENLKHVLSDEEYLNLQKEIFDKMT